jgi:hypothetical protein
MESCLYWDWNSEHFALQPIVSRYTDCAEIDKPFEIRNGSFPNKIQHSLPLSLPAKFVSRLAYISSDRFCYQYVHGSLMHAVA